MAGYQNISIPRFWVSSLQWLNSLGMITASSSNDALLSGKDYKKLSYINPIEAIDFYAGDGQDFSINFDIIEEYNSSGNPLIWKEIMIDSNNFFMLLGHNFIENVFFKTAYETNNQALANLSYINYTSSDKSTYAGFSIGTGNNGHNNPYNRIKLFFNQGYDTSMHKYFSSFLYGTYFDLQAPDLNLTMSREYGASNTLQSKNGSTYKNTFFSKQPNWGNGNPAWSMMGGNYYQWVDTYSQISSSGRRTWDLKFSYLDEQDVFPKMTSLTDYQTGTQNNLKYLKDTLLQENTFYSQVLLRTQGLPFVFQPDSSNSNIDQFAIAMWDQDSFSFERVAPNAYNISLKIREVW